MDDFHRCGYMVVREAFPESTAAECRELMWEMMATKEGIRRDDPGTWPVKCALDVTMREQDGPPWSCVYTPKLQAAIDAICGQGKTEPFGCGWWMNTFPAFPVDPPAQWGIEGAWHIDGHEFAHFAFSREIGLVAIMLFSDVHPSCGGTAIAEGSHWDVVQTMCTNFPEGCTNTQVVRKVLEADVKYDVVEITGQAGDVVLLHPFVLHARSTNLAQRDEAGVRFMCHPRISLKRQMNLEPLGQHSILEESIRAIILDDAAGSTLLEDVLLRIGKPVTVALSQNLTSPSMGGSELYDAHQHVHKVTFATEDDDDDMVDAHDAFDEDEVEVENACKDEVSEMEAVLGFASFKFVRKY